MSTGKSQIGAYASFRPNWRSLTVYMLGVIIFVVGPQINPQAALSPALSYVVAAVFLGFLLVRRMGQHYSVSEQAVEVTVSLPTAGRAGAPIPSIRRIDLRRGVTQRLLGVAHVFIYVDDKPEPALRLYGVPAPEAFRRLLLDLGARDEGVTGAWRR
jgi:membrane protein YdbS with pleckstrin-like domain